MLKEVLEPLEGVIQVRSAADAIRPAPAARASARAKIDGKYFARGGQRLRIQGVTYGPFEPRDSVPLPARAQVLDDFAGMQAIGINAIRTYHVPPEWFLTLADEQRINVFIDVPWPKHLCFLESEGAQREASGLVQEAARR